VRVILDTDPGNGIPGADVDDGLALGLLLRSPEVTIEAITVVAGNVELGAGVRAAYGVLEAAGMSDIPVHRGANRPLQQDPSAWRSLADRRRDDPEVTARWADVPLLAAAGAVAAAPAAQAMGELVMGAPGEITVLAVGPLTNVATAMILEPAFADHVARIVVMGGAFDIPSVGQEFNFSYDPEAAHVVLTSRAPLTIVPLDVTLKTCMRLADVDRLAAARTPLAIFLARTVRPWVEWLAAEFGRDGCPLHDPLAAALLLDPSLVSTRKVCADVELDGTLTRGRSIAWDHTTQPLFTAPYIPLPDVRPVDVAEGVDGDRFLRLMLERLGAGGG
jgi:inosine-uridine nucleoside N-ribohydrolase